MKKIIVVLLCIVVITLPFINLIHGSDSEKEKPLESFTLDREYAVDVPVSTRETTYNYLYPFYKPAQISVKSYSLDYNQVLLRYDSASNEYWYSADIQTGNNYKNAVSDYGGYQYVSSAQYILGNSTYLTYKYIADGIYPYVWSTYTGYTSLSSLFKCYKAADASVEYSVYGLYYTTDGVTFNIVNSMPASTVSSGGKTFIIVWNINQVDLYNSVTLMGNGGTFDGEFYFIFTFSGTTTINVNPTRSGYTFDGYYTDTSYTTPVSAVSDIMNGMYLYAKWSMDSGGGGGSDPPDVTTYNLVLTVISPNGLCTVDGYTYVDISFNYQGNQGVYINYSMLNAHTYIYNSASTNGPVQSVTPSYYSYDINGLQPVQDGLTLLGNTTLYWQYRPTATITGNDPVVSDFASLVGVVVSAPMAWLQVLNFDLFGVNVLGTLTGILTAVLVLWIIITIVRHLRR